MMFLNILQSLKARVRALAARALAHATACECAMDRALAAPGRGTETARGTRTPRADTSTATADTRALATTAIILTKVRWLSFLR